MFDPELAIERAIEYYRRKGYTEDWISQPLFSIRARKNLTFEWRERGVKTNSEYAILTNDIYHAWSDLTAREYKTFKGLTNESLRDNMSDLELALSTLAEATTAEVERATDPESLPEHREVARSGGEVAGIARKAAEKKIGGPVITSTTAPDFGRLIMEVIEVQAIEEEGGCAKRRCGRIGAHPIVTTRWNRLSAWPSVACILLHSHSRTASRVLEYRQQRASASAPPHEAAHCGNRALVSPTTPVRSSQPKGNEEARCLHPRYASDTKPLCRSCARPARGSERFYAAERTRCRIERLACAPFGRPSNRSKRCTHP